MYELRWYQQEAKDAIYEYFRRNTAGNPCVTLPTGAGKTPLLASLCQDALGWQARVCVVTHVKELVEQAYNTLSKMLGGAERVGMYSSGLNKRDTEQAIICAGIQSVYRRAGEFSSSKSDIFEQREVRPFDLLIVDEAHLIPDKGEGMYRQFIAELLEINPKLRVIGLTATPYRLKSGLIYKHSSNMENHSNLIFDENVYEASVKQLITQGYLCPVKSKAGSFQADLTKVAVRAGDYVTREMERAFEDVLVPALGDALAKCDSAQRRSILIFAPSVKAGEHITEIITKSGDRVSFVCDKTATAERDKAAADFKEFKIRFLVNVGVYTTGFDAPNVDCVVLLRATKSAGLYSQMVGRGLRLYQGKSYCLMLDYGDNVRTHGPIDMIKPTQFRQKGEGEAPMKSCPECSIYLHAAIKICPECGFEFTQESIDLLLESSRAGVISGEVNVFEVAISGTGFYVHYKRGFENDPSKPPTLRVEYEVSLTERYTEYVCFEHEGYARQKAYIWWHERCPLVKCPEKIEEAVALCNAGILPETTRIKVSETAGEKFPIKIIGHEYGNPLTADEVEKVLAELHNKEETLNREMLVTAGNEPDWFGDDDIPF